MQHDTGLVKGKGGAFGVVAPDFKDVQPPTVPEGFAASAAGGKVSFAWKPSTDNIMVRNYEILRREGELWKPAGISTLTSLTVPADQCPAGTYAIRAVDVGGNTSEPSKSIEVGK